MSRPSRNLAPVFVDDAALLVHHVVVLEHAFADQEFCPRPSLGVLDRFRQHFRLGRDFGPSSSTGPRVEDLKMRSPRRGGFTSSSGREVEARLAGVALAPERPRSWLSIAGRDSWRSVPQMKKAAELGTSSASAFALGLQLGRLRNQRP